MEHLKRGPPGRGESLNACLIVFHMFRCFSMAPHTNFVMQIIIFGHTWQIYFYYCTSLLSALTPNPRMIACRLLCIKCIAQLSSVKNVITLDANNNSKQRCTNFFLHSSVHWNQIVLSSLRGWDMSVDGLREGNYNFCNSKFVDVFFRSCVRLWKY